MKKITTIIITSFVGILLLSLWFFFIDIHQVVENIKSVNLNWIFIAIIFYVSTVFIRSIRWNIIMRKIKSLTIWRTFVLYMTGNYINFLVPVRAGEFAKSLFLKKINDIPIATSLPAILFDKILDLSPVFIILGLAPFVQRELPQTLWIILIVVFVVMLTVLSLYYLGIKNQAALFKIVEYVFFWLPKSIKGKAMNFFKDGIAGLSIAKQKPSAFLLIIGITLAAVLTDTLYMASIFRAFNVSIPLLYVFIGYTLFNLSYILPTPPAQIGSVEVIMLLIFSGVFGIEKNIMSSVIIVVHSLTGLYIFFAGVISTASLGISVVDTLKKSEPV